MNLTKYEQETIINFNAGEKNATVFTLDSTVMRQLDSLDNEYQDKDYIIGLLKDKKLIYFYINDIKLEEIEV